MEGTQNASTEGTEGTQATNKQPSAEEITKQKQNLEVALHQERVKLQEIKAAYEELHKNPTPENVARFANLGDDWVEKYVSKKQKESQGNNDNGDDENYTVKSKEIIELNKKLDSITKELDRVKQNEEQIRTNIVKDKYMGQLDKTLNKMDFYNTLSKPSQDMIKSYFIMQSAKGAMSLDDTAKGIQEIVEEIAKTNKDKKINDLKTVADKNKKESGGDAGAKTPDGKGIKEKSMKELWNEARKKAQQEMSAVNKT